MTSEDFQKTILPLATDREKVRYKVLYNGYAAAVRSCNEGGGKKALEDFTALELALAEFEDELSKKYTEKPEKPATAQATPADFAPTANKADVLRWLHAAGYEIKKSTFYLHCEQGKLHKSTKGVYTMRLLNKYIRDTGLYQRRSHAHDDGGNQKTAATATTNAPATTAGSTINLTNLPEEKLLAEVKKLREQAARERLKREKEEGKLIAKDALYLELAARAAVLDAGLNHLIQSGCPDLVAVVGGKPDKIPDAIKLLTERKDNLLAEYARADHLLERVL